MLTKRRNSILFFSLFSFVVLSLMSCGSVSLKEKEQKQNADKYTKPFVSRSVASLDSWANCPSTLSWKEAKDKKENKEEKNWQDLVKLANGCVKANRWKEVEMIGNYLAQREPLSPWGVYYLSLSSLQSRDYRRSLWMIENALKKAPSTALFLYQKGRVLWELSEMDAALSVFESVLRFEPKNSDVHLLLGQIYFRDLDYQRASQHLEQALEKRKKDVLVLDQLSYCYFKQKRSAEGLALVNEAIDLAPKRFDLRMRQAQIFDEQMKDTDKALSSYRQIKNLLSQGQISGVPLFNLDEKIKNLESIVSQRKPAGTKEKVVSQKNEENKEGVKK